MKLRMNLRISLFLILATTAFFTACQNDNQPKLPDVSDVAVEFDVRRFEQALFALDTTQLAGELPALRAEFPVFSDLYFQHVIRLPKDSLAQPAYLQGFLNFEPLQRLDSLVKARFADFSPYQKELEQALRYYYYHFPAEPKTQLTTFISEYSLAGFIYGEDQIAIGLDYFLGPDFDYKEIDSSDPAFSDYLTRTYTPEHLTSKAMQLLVTDLLGPARGSRMLDQMVHNGKQHYIMKQLLPSTPDSILFEISGAQMDWLNNNEREMWAFFLKEDLLYNTEWQRIRKFVEPSPNSPGMPTEAPGRTANYIGYRIVEAYMQRFPQTSLEQLIAMTDAQQLMDQARFKPGR